MSAPDGAASAAVGANCGDVDESGLSDSEQRLRLALDAARMGTWEWDIASGRVLWSPGLEAIHGLPAGTFGSTFEAYRQDIHPQDREYVEDAIRATLKSGTDHRIEYRIVRPDGTVRWVEGRGKLFRDAAGNPLRMMGVCVDVHDRKEAEAALRLSQEELKNADRRKDRFLATLSHELRNPLAPLGNGLRMLRRVLDDPEQVAQCLSMMERQFAQLVRLVDDLMEVSRITQGKISLRKQRVELAQILRQAVETSRPLVAAGGHVLSVEVPDEPIVLDADALRLAQVLSNLLNNAAKYTPHGGRIGVRVERRDGQAVIGVQDTGVGISPQLLPRIFEMFAQGDASPEQADGGLGIGLMLVKQLVEMHGGAVAAESAGPGRGSRFEVRLPIAVEPPCTAAPTAAPEPAATDP